jgi:hypothetical protein
MHKLLRILLAVWRSARKYMTPPVPAYVEIDGEAW